jgi:uncharacterized LabA/DUF88 family protein
MSTNSSLYSGEENATEDTRKRVYGFVDGFNLYHAMQEFRHPRVEEDKVRFRKYKWLCLWSLIDRFVDEKTERLVGVEYFTAYPTWNKEKDLRHKTYVSAQISRRVHVTFGEFKRKTQNCRGACKEQFETHEEKQTDVNISTALIGFGDLYDKAILLTEDSDQVPAVRLFKKLYPNKTIFTLPPIGRNSKELVRVCDGKFTMDEQALIDCQLPNPMPIMKDGKQTSSIVKPSTW